MNATLLASAGTLDAISDSIARFYCGESKTLIPDGRNQWAVAWAHDEERITGVRVIRKGGRFRFEMI